MLLYFGTAYVLVNSNLVNTQVLSFCFEKIDRYENAAPPHYDRLYPFLYSA